MKVARPADVWARMRWIASVMSFALSHPSSQRRGLCERGPASFGPERPGCSDIHPPAQQSLKIELELGKVEQAAARVKADQDVHVADLVRGVAGDRAKQAGIARSRSRRS